jgi:hypothetical protein
MCLLVRSADAPKLTVKTDIPDQPEFWGLLDTLALAVLAGPRRSPAWPRETLVLVGPTPIRAW